MSYAAPFNLLSFHVSGYADSIATRLTWPLAGSLAIHVVVLIALVGWRFGPSFEQPAGSYQVALVTLPEISGPRAKPRVPELVTGSLMGALESVVVPKPRAMTVPQKAVPAVPAPFPLLPVEADPKPTPQQNTGKVPPPLQAEAEEAPKPERVTESLVGALESVVVPKPRAMNLPQKAAPVPDPPPPLTQSSALKVEAPVIQPLPQPPQLALSPVPRKPKPLVPAPSVDSLTQTLKQAVDTIDVPEERKKPKQAGRIPVSPVAKSDREQKQAAIETSQSSGITLPSQAPAVTPLSQTRETPVQTAQKSPTAESVARALEKVQIPKPMKQPTETVSKAVPLLPEVSPKRSTAAEAQDQVSTVKAPQAPQLTEMPEVSKEPGPSQPTTPKPEPDTRKNEIPDLPIPQRQTFEAGQPGSRQAERGTQETLTDLRVEGSSPKENVYWGKVKSKIAGRWIPPPVEFQRRQSLPVVLAFRVERNGQVTELTVVRSSGNEYSDLAAKRAVVAASPLPAFPANMTQPFYEVKYTFTGPPNRSNR